MSNSLDHIPLYTRWELNAQRSHLGQNSDLARPPEQDQMIYGKQRTWTAPHKCNSEICGHCASVESTEFFLSVAFFNDLRRFCTANLLPQPALTTDGVLFTVTIDRTRTQEFYSTPFALDCNIFYSNQRSNLTASFFTVTIARTRLQSFYSNLKSNSTVYALL